MEDPKQPAPKKYNEERAVLVVKLIEAGFTLSKVGEMLGLTRERVRQVYAKKTGHGVIEHRVSEKIALVERALPALLKMREKICRHCSTPFTRKYAQAFCSKACARSFWNHQQMLRRKYIDKRKNREIGLLMEDNETITR